MFVVLGATGNTGKVVASTLLAQGKAVRVVMHREAGAGQAWREGGADVVLADLEDRAALGRAFAGAEGAYVLLPPALRSSQVRVDNDRRAKNIAAAIAAAGTWDTSSCFHRWARSTRTERAPSSTFTTPRPRSAGVSRRRAEPGR